MVHFSEGILRALKGVLTINDDDILKLNTFQNNFESSLTENVQREFNFVWDGLGLAEHIAAIKECIDKQADRNSNKNAGTW